MENKLRIVALDERERERENEINSFFFINKLTDLYIDVAVELLSNCVVCKTIDFVEQTIFFFFFCRKA